jgi:hypothetical protein
MAGIAAFRATHLLTCACVALTTAACADDSQSIVGSGHVIERKTQVDIVEKVKIVLPFRADLVNGPPKELLLRGEDNLLDQIVVEELEPSWWQLRAPLDLDFTQHSTIEIAIPYVDMVLLEIKGEDVLLKQHPSEVWHDAGSDGGS